MKSLRKKKKDFLSLNIVFTTVFVFLVLAFLILLNFLFLHQQLRISEYNQNMMRFIGNMRTDITRTGLLGQTIAQSTDLDEKRKYLEELKQNLPVMKASFNKLFIDKLPQGPDLTPKVNMLSMHPEFVESINGRMRHFIQEIEILVQSNPAMLRLDNPQLDFINHEAIDGKLAADFDFFSEEFKRMSYQRMSTMRLRGTAVFIFSVIILSSIILFIFVPLILKVQSQIKSLIESNQLLEERATELRANRRAMFSILEDVQKARIEAERAKNDAYKLAAIVEYSNDAIIGETLDATIESWNQGAEKLYGYTAQEAIGKKINIVVPESLRGEIPEIMAKILRGEVVQNYETTRVHKNGMFIDVSLTVSPIKNDQGQLIGASANARDITQQKKEQIKFRTAVEAAPNGMIMADSHSNITLTNSHAEQLFGYSAAEMIGKPFEELLTARFHLPKSDKNENYFNYLERAFLSKKVELYGLTKEGGEFPIVVRTNPLVTEAGAFVLTTIVDITDRKMAEEALRKALADLGNSNAELERYSQELKAANEKLQELDKLKSDFIMIASHELRTPLSSIKGYISLILNAKAGDINTTQKEFLSHVLTAANRLHRLVNELLNLSKIESGQLSFQMSPESLADLLKEEVMTFKAESERKEIDLKLALENELGMLICDKDRLGEVIDNLLSNAIKYTPRKGSIEVKAKRLPSSIEISIKDTGLGIPAEKKEKIFEPFYRIHKTGSEGEESVGLGLALVKKIVDVHRGRIIVESEVDKGSEFKLVLPIS